jgi:hypothetical protein
MENKQISINKNNEKKFKVYNEKGENIPSSEVLNILKQNNDIKIIHLRKIQI